MMSPAQRARYWRLWRRAVESAWPRGEDGVRRLAGEDALAVEVDQVSRVLAQGRERTEDDLRHALHYVALRRLCSSRRLTNADLDRVYAGMRLLADPLDLRARLEWDHPEIGARRRYDHVIRTAAPAAYTRALARDKFGRVNLAELNDTQARHLAMTLRNRRPAFPARPAVEAP